MTTNSQKNIEESYALKLAELLNENWKVENAPDEISWPDLLVDGHGPNFGLEVREIYSDESRKGSPKRAKESSHIKQVKLICERYYKISSTPIIVKFLGCIKDVEKIIDCISAIESLDDFQQVKLEPYFGSLIFVTKLPDSCIKYDRWIYVSDKVGWVSKLNLNIIESKILEKAVKLPKYSEHLNDVRLLLVCNSLLNSGKYQIPDVSELDTQGFTKVYVLKYPDSLSVIGS
jgi:hypothetical protein